MNKNLKIISTDAEKSKKQSDKEQKTLSFFIEDTIIYV
jgi:hypothetical protein